MITGKYNEKLIDGQRCYFEHDGTVNISLLDPYDTTANELFDYDARCSRCWLNSAHSGHLHRYNVKLAIANDEAYRKMKAAGLPGNHPDELKEQR